MDIRQLAVGALFTIVVILGVKMIGKKVGGGFGSLVGGI